MYTPLNVCVYLKAVSGCLAGLGANAAVPLLADYSLFARMADFFGQQVDTVWGAAAPTSFEEDAIEELSEGVWENRSAPLTTIAFTAAAYNPEAQAIVAMVRAASTAVVAEGVDPNGCNAGAAEALADLYGLAEDGDMTVSAPLVDFLGGDFGTFVLDAGVTVTARINAPVIIRATKSVTINGTISASGRMEEHSINSGLYGTQSQAGGGGGGGGGGNNSGNGQAGQAGTQASYAAPSTSHIYGFVASANGTAGASGTAGGSPSGPGGNGGDGTSGTLGAATPDLRWRLRVRSGVSVALMAGGCPGADGTNGGDGGAGGPDVSLAGGAGGDGGPGGWGGASIYIIAPVITFGAASQLLADGDFGDGGGDGADGAGPGGEFSAGGGGGGGGAGGQGGSGGIIIVRAGVTLNGAPLVATAAAGVGGPGGAGGSGSIGATSTGGDGGAGGDGLNGVAGLVSIGLIGSVV